MTNRIKRTHFFLFALWASLTAPVSHAIEDLISTAHYKDGTVVPYILNATDLNPKFVIILFPGGTGNLNPRMIDGKLAYDFSGNFVIRTRPEMVDSEFATIATDASQSQERIQAILDDIKTRFPHAQVYLMSTSRGTFDTMRLSKYLSDKIAGVIHTSSFNEIVEFDSRKFKNRHLLVHHRKDACHHTLFVSAQRSHDQFGTELIAMDGGISIGNVCAAQAYHGFNGIERETIAKIKEWIKRGPGTPKP